MIAVDTNILVYAFRTDSRHHSRARAAVESVANGRAAWGIPWPCVHEFLSIADRDFSYFPQLRTRNPLVSP